RLKTLNTRTSPVAVEEAVLPISLEYDAVEKEKIRFNADSEDHAGCKAKLAIVPKAFVGWNQHFQEKAAKFYVYRDHPDPFYLLTPSEVAHFQVDNAEMVIERLDSMFCNAIPNALIRFKALLNGIIEYDRRAAAASDQPPKWH
ncbi:MAG: hypothetical protein Q9174_005834, partial [Haloplaca sp. 1 TL-2023]